jgi:hypothetical protein
MYLFIFSFFTLAGQMFKFYKLVLLSLLVVSLYRTENTTEKDAGTCIQERVAFQRLESTVQVVIVKAAHTRAPDHARIQ